MRSDIIATVYLRGQGSQKRVPTTPGRAVDFRGGAATIRDDRDMPHMLRMPGVQVELHADYLDRLPRWLERVPLSQRRALIVLLDRDNLTIGPAPDYAVTDAALTAAAGKKR